VVAAVELVATVIALTWGAAGAVEVVLLLIWIAVTLVTTSSYFARRRAWAENRLGMTHDLIERMVGHRSTRLTQLLREHWHDGEDEALEPYLGVSARMDKSAALLMSLVPGGWIVVGYLGSLRRLSWVVLRRLLWLLPWVEFSSGYNALRCLVSGLGDLADVIISWKQIAALFHAAARLGLVGPPCSRSPRLPRTSQGMAHSSRLGSPCSNIRAATSRC
jgi:ATP-binding cassette, subfamily B, bacterial